MSQQPTVTGNILSFVQNSALSNPDNWKTLRPKAYDVYVAGILEGMHYSITLKTGQKFNILGTSSLLVYGPTAQYRVVPITMAKYMRHEDGTTGADFLNKHTKLAPHGLNFSNNVAIENTKSTQIKYLPWTKVSINEGLVDCTYFGFKCPSNWKNIQITATPDAFGYLLTEYAKKGLLLNKNSKDPDFIVIQGPKGASPQNALNMTALLKTGRAYDSNTFAQMYDMRTYAGTDVDKIALECPPNFFVAKEVTEEKTMTFQEALIAVKDKLGIKVNDYNSIQFEKLPESVLDDTVSLEDFKKYSSSKFDKNAVITVTRSDTIQTPSETPFPFLHVVLKNKYDAILFLRGFTQHCVKFDTTGIIPVVSQELVSIKDLLA